MEKDNKQYIIIITLLAAIFIFIIAQNRFYKNELINTRAELQSIQNNLRNLYGDIYTGISNSFRSALDESANRVSDYNLSINSINTGKKLANLSVDFTAKSIAPNAEVFVLYQGEKSKDWQEIPAENNGLLSFHAAFDLSLEDNYILKFVEKTNDGGIANLNTMPITKNLYWEFYENRTRVVSGGRGENRDEITFHMEIQNNTFGLEEYKVKSVECQVSYKDVLVYNKDITNLIVTNQADLHEYYLKLASGEIDHDSTAEIRLESLQDDNISPDNIQNLYFDITLNKDELSSQFPDLFDGKSDRISSQNTSTVHNLFSIKVTVTYNSGETMEL